MLLIPHVWPIPCLITCLFLFLQMVAVGFVRCIGWQFTIRVCTFYLTSWCSGFEFQLIHFCWHTDCISVIFFSVVSQPKCFCMIIEWLVTVPISMPVLWKNCWFSYTACWLIRLTQIIGPSHCWPVGLTLHSN